MEANGHQEIAPGNGLFRIGQVSRLTDTKPFVLRYWETEFPMLQPVKSPKGHRLYRRQDVETVLLIKRLLYDDGFTIAGARRHLREAAVSGEAAGEQGSPAPMAYAGASTELESDILQASGEMDGEREPMAAAAAAGAVGATVPVIRYSEPPVNVSRKVLLDLRDSLQAFLTLLESE